MSNVIISHNKRLVFQNTDKASYTNTARAELQALHSLLKNAKRLNIRHLEVISDSKTVVEIVLSRKKTFKGTDAKKMNMLLDNTRSLILHFEHIKIEFKKRKYNVYADSLCRLNWQGISFSKKGGEVDLSKPLKIERTCRK